MEAFATVQVVSSIVQLVEFGSNCLAKGLQLYRSSSGVLDEHLAIEATAAHLSILNETVKTSAVSVADQALEDLCGRITDTAAELLAALEKLKIQGPRTKWRCMRKAIKSVWGKEKLIAIEGRLASFQNELNLHVCVSLKTSLGDNGIQTTTRFDQLDARTQEVVSALANNQDLFSSALHDQTVLLEGLEEDIRRSAKDNHAVIQSVVRKAVVHVQDAVKEEQCETRVTIREVGDHIVGANVTAVQTLDARLQTTIDTRAQENSLQHIETQSCIEDLQERLSQLTKQIAERDREFRTTLEALKAASSAKTRRSLRERSNAIAATLLALGIMYSHVKAMLEALTMKVVDWAEWSRAWSESLRADRDSRIELNTKPTPGRVDPFKIHGLYFASRLERDLLRHNRTLVDDELISRKWSIPTAQANFQDGRYNVSTLQKDVWLLVIINASLIRIFDQSACASELLSPFLQQESIKRSNAVEDDLQYATKFADLRGMLENPKDAATNTKAFPAERTEQAKFDFGSLIPVELAGVKGFLHWLLQERTKPLERGFLVVRSNSVVHRLVVDLIWLGLKINCEPKPIDLTAPKSLQVRSDILVCAPDPGEIYCWLG